MNTLDQEIASRLHDPAWSGRIAIAVNRRVKRRRALAFSAAALVLLLGVTALLVRPDRREAEPLGNEFITSQIRGTAGTDTLMSADPAMEAILISYE
jgi:hypothetical protein